MNKIILTILGVSFLLNIFLFDLFLSYSEQKSTLEATLGVCTSSLENVEKVAENSAKRCSLIDSTVAEYQDASLSHQTALDKELVKLDEISKRAVALITFENISNDAKKSIPSPYVPLNGRLPDDVVRLLREACERNKGGVCLYP